MNTNSFHHPGTPVPDETAGAAVALQAPAAPGGTHTPGSAANEPPAGQQAAALALPAPLLQARRWLLWCWGELRHDGKRAKVPWYVHGGRRGVPDTPEDTAQLATYVEARAKLDRPLSAYAGIGFALGDGWQGIDLDSVAQNQLADLANELPGYVELSPSGSGCHAIGYGRAFHNLAPKGGIEAYCSGRFFTFTATPIRLGPLCCLADYVEQRLVIRHGVAGPTEAVPGERMPDQPQTQSDDEVMRSFWHARNAERFRMLWHGEGLHLYGNDHSAADQALMTQLAFYTQNDDQLVRLFHASALGERDKAWRQDYIDRTVARARATHAPKLAGIAAARAAMAPAIDAALAAQRTKGGAR